MPHWTSAEGRWRTLVGSSRSVRFTMILASRSVRYPLGRNLVLVLAGATGIMKNEATVVSGWTDGSLRMTHYRSEA